MVQTTFAPDGEVNQDQLVSLGGLHCCSRPHT